jgi:hypothetical protein
MVKQKTITPNVHPHLNSYTQDIQPSKKSTDGKTTDLYNEVGPLRFELKSLAPQARRIPSYPTGPR